MSIHHNNPALKRILFFGLLTFGLLYLASMGNIGIADSGDNDKPLPPPYTPPAKSETDIYTAAPILEVVEVDTQGQVILIEETKEVSGTVLITVYGFAPITSTMVFTPTGIGAILATAQIDLVKTFPVTITYSNGAIEKRDITLSGEEDIAITKQINQPGRTEIVSTDNPLLTGYLYLSGVTPVTATIKGESVPLTVKSPGYIQAWFTYYAYLPNVIHSKPTPTPTPIPTPRPGYLYFDDFSDSGSGWPVGSTHECNYEYYNGYYVVIAYRANDRCIIPAPAKANHWRDGSFEVKAYRDANSSHGVMYGFFFNGRQDPDHYRWALEVLPDKVNNCKNDKPFYWLSYLSGSKSELVNDGKTCTNQINTDNNWNTLKVVRYGDFAQAFLNGQSNDEYYRNILNDQNNDKYFFLEVIATDPNTSYKNPKVVYFDDVGIKAVD